MLCRTKYWLNLPVDQRNRALYGEWPCRVYLLFLDNQHNEDTQVLSLLPKMTPLLETEKYLWKIF